MIAISLDFMPAFYSRHIGLEWGEGYYFDPARRSQIETTRDRFLYDILGDYGVGSPNPTPSPGITIQPVDLVMRTQGAEWRFPADAAVESWGTPWQGMSVAEISALDPRAAADHPVVDAIIRQHTELRKLYGEAADVLGLRSGTMVIHGPYTTAHQLIGQDLFMLMYDDPRGARQVFDRVWEIYQAVFGKIARAVEAPPVQRVHIGDCAASLISAELYRTTVLPADNRVAESFSACSYHSCGPSSHLLQEFALVQGLDAIQLGPGTDLGLAQDALAESVHFQPLIDPMLMRDGGGDTVHSAISQITQRLERRGGGTLCAWSLDVDTPIENVARMYETVAEAGK